MLSVWGGKITTFRKLAEEAADQIAPTVGATRGAWTQDTHLPGGDLSGLIGAAQRPDTDFERFVQAVCLRHPQLARALIRRLARAYGSRIDRVLGADGLLGAEVAPGLHEAELRYLHGAEWAQSADDVLWRRSKLGLHLDAAGRERVRAWCDANWSVSPAVGASSPEDDRAAPVGAEART